MAGVAASGRTQREAPELPFTSAAELEALTRPAPPAAVETVPASRHRRPDPTLVQEEISWPSAVPVRFAESNRARALVYRRGALGERPVVLWVPGQYVVDLAFVPIGWLVDEILSRGADVVLFVPPYHLERTPAGFDSGDAVLATDLPDHFTVLAQQLSDLRSLAAWVRARGARTLGAFGGSLGATMLLRLATWDDGLDFLTVFIPVIRIDDILLEPPEAEPIRRRLGVEGRRLEDVARLYASFDPGADRPRLDPARVAVLYGRHDLVAPEGRILAWARAWGVTRLYPQDRGHALALLNRQLYADYGRILDEDLAAVRSGAAAGRGAAGARP